MLPIIISHFKERKGLYSQGYTNTKRRWSTGEKLTKLIATKEKQVERISQKGAGLVSPAESEEERKIIDQLRTDIKIIGSGGSGSNTINRCTEEGIFGAKTIAVNTDANHLLTIRADRKVLLGRRVTRGLGAGAIPQVGEEAAREAEDDILNALGKVNIAIVTTGMGGGTGTGSVPVIAGLAKSRRALVISVVTLPFSAEGRVRMENALYGLEEIRRNSDTTIVIPNDKLLQLVPRLPLDQAFKVADTILMEAIKDLTEIITKPGLVNLDYADIKTVMAGGGMAMIGIGESDANGRDKVEQAVTMAISSPLIEGDISGAKGALVKVIGDGTMRVAEAETAVRLVQQKISQNAKIIWGASIDPSLKRVIKVMVILTGVKSPYMLSGREGLGVPDTVPEAVIIGTGKNFELDLDNYKEANNMKIEMANQLHISIHVFNKYYESFSKDLDGYFKERKIPINDFEKMLLLKAISEVARSMRDES